MATPNPLHDSHPAPPPPVSIKTFHIAGIIADVYGLDEVSPSCKSISCLWLLHPRLSAKERMAPVASICINDCNQRPPSGDRKVGLIAVAFDQRNHGTREVNALANEAWRGGNETHAQDMFRYFSSPCLILCSEWCKVFIMGQLLILAFLSIIWAHTFSMVRMHLRLSNTWLWESH
jgi:hypothetical protein